MSYSPFIKRRKQIVSKNDDLFDILRGSQTWLSTVELSCLDGTLIDPINYNFESCLFTKDDSEVIARHRNWEDAVEYHMHIAKGYGLTIHEERVIV